MRVKHPYAGDGDCVPPAAVDVAGETVAVDDDGTFEVDNEAWLQQFAAAHDVAPDDLVVSQEGPPPDDEVAGSGTLPINPESHTVDDLREEIQTIDDAETLRALRNLEADQKNRETALDAIESRLADVEG
ncbi:hypothetical protein BRC81_02985 [Halobacteriales archaeon QS_1_68_20]|nr:MAG: hypothetical protein BRC81_02985 [Halobacteriales archaeon QS_1_68_20]